VIDNHIFTPLAFSGALLKRNVITILRRGFHAVKKNRFTVSLLSFPKGGTHLLFAGFRITRIPMCHFAFPKKRQ